MHHKNLEMWRATFASVPGWTGEIRLIGRRCVFTADPENIKAILATQFGDYGKGEPFHRYATLRILYQLSGYFLAALRLTVSKGVEDVAVCFRMLSSGSLTWALTLGPKHWLLLPTSRPLCYRKTTNLRCRREWEPFLGDSIFATDGEKWKASRHLIRPQFIKEVRTSRLTTL
jgi:hypothetical protein